MDFVDDVDLVARRSRGIADAVDQPADVVDAGAAGGVHFEDIDVAALGDFTAGLAFAARRYGRPALAVGPDAVQGPGDDAGGGRLADTADTGQQERMGDAVGLEGVGQGPHQHVLAD